MARTYPIRLRSSRKRTVCGCFCRIGSRVDPYKRVNFQPPARPFFPAGS